MSITLFTTYKDISPESETVRVTGSIEVGYESLHWEREIDVEIKPFEEEIEIDESDIRDLTDNELVSLLVAVWRTKFEEHEGHALDKLEDVISYVKQRRDTSKNEGRR
jgi:hypothetical protein